LINIYLRVNKLGDESLPKVSAFQLPLPLPCYLFVRVYLFYDGANQRRGCTYCICILGMLRSNNLLAFFGVLGHIADPPPANVVISSFGLGFILSMEFSGISIILAYALSTSQLGISDLVSSGLHSGH